VGNGKAREAGGERRKGFSSGLKPVESTGFTSELKLRPPKEKAGPADAKLCPFRRVRQRTNREKQALTYKGLRLVLEELLDCGGQVFGLGEDYVFELGLVGAESVHGGYAGHRSI
jgi:hypothetical protein